MNQELYFIGPKEFLAPDSEIVVSVLLDSSEPVNAFELEVNYEEEKLKFLGSDNTGSIVDIWQTKPTNVKDGVVEFNGGILNDFKGDEGLIVKLSFKVLDTGVATDTLDISFTKNNVYLADGKGTKVEVPTLSFPLRVKEGAKVVSSPFVPFQNTSSDEIIQKELENFESQVFYQKSLNLLSIFAGIIFVICILTVYNKRK